MAASQSNHTVTVLPETEGPTLCLRNSGLVQADDHNKHLRDNIEKLVTRYGYFKVLIYYDEIYRGYTPEAADLSIRSMLDFGKYARKIAYVNPPETRILLHKVLPDVFSAEVRFFNKDKLDQAMAWIKS